MAKKHGAAGAADLTITSEAVEPRQVRLTITVSPEREAREMGQVAQAYARRLKVPGYRPGHVPLRVVTSQVGEDELRQAAREQLADKVAREAIRAEGVLPYDNPVLEGQTDEPLIYTILVPLRPTVDLGDYRALRVPEPAAEPVSEDDVAERLEGLRQELTHLETVDRPAAAGDRVIVALVGRQGDQIVVEDDSLALDLTADGASEAGLPTAIIDELVGLGAGAAREFDLTYSEFWPAVELQGQTVRFAVTVDSVQGLTPPTLDDAFAQEVSDAGTLAELRERIREGLVARHRIEARERWVEAAVAALVDQAQVQAPPSLFDDEVDAELDALRARVERQGFTWERWLALQEKDEATLFGELEPEVNRRVRTTLVLSEFAEAEGIRVSRTEIEGALSRQNEALARAGMRLPRNDAVRRRMGGELLTGRTLDRLLEIVSGTDDGGTAPAEAPESSESA
jgi:trigger factor